MKLNQLNTKTKDLFAKLKKKQNKEENDNSIDGLDLDDLFEEDNTKAEFIPTDSDEVSKIDNSNTSDENTQDKKNKNASKCIYITPKLDTTITEKTDIILAPQFYWVREQKFENGDLKQLKKIAPSIFDGYFQNSEDFQFFVTKSDKKEYFVFIAYDIKDIFQKLKDKYGAKESLIRKIYVAQTEFSHTHKPLTVNRKFVLLNVDGIISEIPHSQDNDAFEYVSTYIRKTPRTKESLNISKIYSSNVSKFQFIATAFIFLLFMSGLILEILNLNKEAEKLTQDKEFFVKKYNLPQTSFQLDSIKGKLITLQREQFSVRKAFKWIDSLRTEKYGKLKYLNVTQKEIQFKLELKQTQTNLNSFKKEIQKRDKRAFIDINKNIVTCKIKI